MKNTGPDVEANYVELVENLGEWLVRVVKDGASHVSSFEIEAYARSYAEGQRIRLGLDKIKSSDI